MKTLALIETPYGYKTPDLLCKAMDAYAVQPDLLAALEKVIRLYGVDLQPAHRDEIRSAIAKAKGE
jgi:hypothetical protein